MRATALCLVALATPSCSLCVLPGRAAAIAVRRAPAAIACDYENDGDSDEMEDALARYAAMGLVDGDEDDDDDDDEVTAEMMQVRRRIFAPLAIAVLTLARVSCAGVVQGSR